MGYRLVDVSIGITGYNPAMSKTRSHSSTKTAWTRRQLLQLPPAARRPILEEQAIEMAQHYQPSPERDCWQKGDFVEYPTTQSEAR